MAFTWLTDDHTRFVEINSIQPYLILGNENPLEVTIGNVGSLQSFPGLENDVIDMPSNEIWIISFLKMSRAGTFSARNKFNPPGPGNQYFEATNTDVAGFDILQYDSLNTTFPYGTPRKEYFQFEPDTRFAVIGTTGAVNRCWFEIYKFTA